MVFDSNVSAQKMKPTNPGDDVHLTDGTGFMTGDARYKAHLKVAKEVKEVREIPKLANHSDVTLVRDRNAHATTIAPLIGRIF